MEPIWNQSMSRRDFFKLSGTLAFSLLAYGIPGAWAAKTIGNAVTSQRLVVIFLRGALDGLSALVPYGDENYYAIRPTIAVPRPGQTGGVLPLDNYFGLNPNLDALLPFWQKRQLSFVLNSGSPNGTRSHFDAQDYMESGTPGVKSTSDGWMNRLLQVLPSNNSPTRAIGIGSELSRILEGRVPVANIDSQPFNPNQKTPLERPRIANTFDKLYQGNDALSQAYHEGMEADQSLVESLSHEMMEANRGAPNAGGFSQTSSKVLQLLKNDPTIQTVFIPLGGWDTHVNQGSVSGSLARNLKGLGDGLGLLMNGLSNDEINRTTVVVMSEFGRTVHENGNQGTDHGHGNFIWILGPQLYPQPIQGQWVGLQQQQLFEGRDLPVSTDFRIVLSDILRQRFSLNPMQLRQIFPG